MTKTEKIKEFWQKNPTMSSEEVARIMEISPVHARQVKSVSGITNKKHSQVLEKVIEDQRNEIIRLKKILLSLLQE